MASAQPLSSDEETDTCTGAPTVQAAVQTSPPGARRLILPLNSPFSDPPCSTHGDQPENMFCRTCSKLLCAVCFFSDHKDHDVILAKEMKEKMQEQLADEISALRDEAAKCAANKNSLNDRLQEAEAGLKTERRLLTDRRAAAEASLKEEHEAAVELLDQDLEDRIDHLNKGHDGALAQTETVWGDVIADLKAAVSSRDQAGKASSQVLADTQDIGDTPGQLEAARASVAQVRADVPDVTTPVALPAPSPHSQFAHLAELHVEVVSAEFLVSLKSLEEEKKAEEERQRREETERRMALEVQQELVRLLPKKPSTSGDYDHIAVPAAVYRSWQEAARGSRTRPLPLLWPDVSAPLRWWRDVTASDVVLLPPEEARAVVRLVGGRDLLTKQAVNSCHALVADDGQHRYVSYRIHYRRGGGVKNLGWYFLPSTSTVREALTGVTGTAPHDVTDGHHKTVELGLTCGEQRRGIAQTWLSVNK